MWKGGGEAEGKKPVRERGGEKSQPRVRRRHAFALGACPREMERARTQRGREGVASVQVQGVCPLSMFDCGGQGVLLDFLWAAWR